MSRPVFKSTPCGYCASCKFGFAALCDDAKVQFAAWQKAVQKYDQEHPPRMCNCAIDLPHTCEVVEPS